MKTFSFLLFLISPFVIADQLEVSLARVKASIPGSDNSVGYLHILNSSKKNRVLIGARTSVASVVELHSHMMIDDRMKMRRVDKIDVSAGASVIFEPGGYHLMLIDLQKKLVPNETIVIYLQFMDGTEKETTFSVYDPRKKSSEAMDHSHHH